MKKLSEIKTGEKFEYKGQFYIGMEAADPDYEDVTIAINIETGKCDLGCEAADLMVRPIEVCVAEKGGPQYFKMTLLGDLFAEGYFTAMTGPTGQIKESSK